MYDPTFDPVERLTALNVRLVSHPLYRHDALWVPRRRMVIVNEHLEPAHVTPVLTHEYVHVINDDPGGHHPRNEARANLISALILTNPNRWADLTAIHSDYDHICLELGITREQFVAYYQHQLRRAA